MANIERKLRLPEPDRLNKFEVELADILSRYTTKLGDIFSKGIRITDNLNVNIVTKTTANANTEVVVAHGLKRVPSGYMVVDIDKAGTVYSSGTAFTDTNIYVKCTTATTTIKLLVF